MSTTPEPANEIQLLQASVDADDDSYFRLLFHGKHIKYITIAAGVYEDDDMCFAPTLLSILPPFPPGDWNNGYIATHPETGKPFFQSAVRTQFPGVQSTWHSKNIDYLDLKLREKLRTNVYTARLPNSPECVVVAKFARFGWEIGYVDQECAAYKWIEGTDIGPKFLGNIVEEGRVIGFLLEHIAGARHASPADYPACQQVLSKLHRIGITHGDINRHNVLVIGDRAVLIDFDSAQMTTDKRSLEKEMGNLKEQLASTSGKGGMSVGAS